MKKLLFSALLLITTLLHAQTHFGALIQAPDGLTGTAPLNFKLKTARSLALTCVRDESYLNNLRTIPLLDSGYTVVLNINITTSGTGNIRFIRDTAGYRRSLVDALGKLKRYPICVVIENEMGNDQYYSDYAINYMPQYKTAIKELHSRGVKVADGGVTRPPLVYLYALTLPLDSQKAVLKRNGIAVKSPSFQRAAAFTDSLLSRIRYSAADYVNYHWYWKKGDDLNDLIGCIKYLRKRSGKTVMTNESGQLDEDPTIPARLVKIAKDNNLAFFIWYSNSSSKYAGKTVPLQDANGRPTQTGIAYYSAIIQ